MSRDLKNDWALMRKRAGRGNTKMELFMVGMTGKQKVRRIKRIFESVTSDRQDESRRELNYQERTNTSGLRMMFSLKREHMESKKVRALLERL